MSKSKKEKLILGKTKKEIHKRFLPVIRPARLKCAVHKAGVKRTKRK